MKKLLLALALLLAPTVGWAQCSGQFPNQTVCGNTSGTANFPRSVSLASVISGSVAIKTPVDLATTGSNITLSGEQTIDGVLTSSSRVLVKDQSTASQNGIYTSGSGAWTRTADWNATGQVVQGTQVKVSQGAVNRGAIFWVITANPITIGTTAVTMSGEINVVASSTKGYTHVPVNFILNEDLGSFGSANTHNSLAVVGGKDVATSNTTGSWNLHTDSYYGAGGTAPDFFVASQSIMYPFYNWSGGVPAFNIHGRFFARGDNINIPSGMSAEEATGQEIDVTTAGSVTADRHGIRIVDLGSTGAHALYESGLSILSSGIGFNNGIYLGDEATGTQFPIPAGGTILKTVASSTTLAAGIDFSNLTGAFPGFIFGSDNGDIRFFDSNWNGGRIISRTGSNGMIAVFGSNIVQFKDHADAFAPFEFNNIGSGSGKLYVGNGAGGAGTGTLQLGSSGFLGSIIMGNATTGLMTLQPVTGALGTVTVSIPAATDTLVNLASSQALINKSYNGLTLTSTTGTFTLAAAKTLTVNNTLTFSGTDGSTLNVGGGGTLGTAAYQNTGTSGATLPFLNGTNTWGSTQTFSVAPVFTDQSGTRTALSLGTFATQNYTTPPIIGGTTPAGAFFSTLGVNDTSVHSQVVWIHNATNANIQMSSIAGAGTGTAISSINDAQSAFQPLTINASTLNLVPTVALQIGGTNTVSCGVGTLNTATAVVTNGFITHC